MSTLVPHNVVRDSSLSFRARGLLAYLLTLPAGSQPPAEQLAQETPGEGRDAIRTALTELEDAGYLIRRRHQGADGRWRTDCWITGGHR